MSTNPFAMYKGHLITADDASTFKQNLTGDLICPRCNKSLYLTVRSLDHFAFFSHVDASDCQGYSEFIHKDIIDLVDFFELENVQVSRKPLYSASSQISLFKRRVLSSSLPYDCTPLKDLVTMSNSVLFGLDVLIGYSIPSNLDDIYKTSKSARVLSNLQKERTLQNFRELPK